MEAKVKWIREISAKDKEQVYLLFDWKNKKKWNLKELRFSGGRNLFFKLDKQINYNGTRFRCLKIKGHHYMTGKKMMKPKPVAYYGAGTPANIKILRRNPSVPKEEILHRLPYENYTLYVVKSPMRAKGSMNLCDALNEVRIQNHLLENNCVSPLPLATAEYDFDFNGEKQGAHIMALPEEDLRTAHFIDLFVLSKEKRVIKEKKQLISTAVKWHFKGLRKLHDNNVVHFFAHYGNSQPSRKSGLALFTDFENSYLLRKKDKEFNNLYKAIDLSEVLGTTYHFTKDMEKQKINDNYFWPALQGYGFPKEETSKLSYFLEDKTFGEFHKFCEFNFALVNSTKETIRKLSKQKFK